MTRPLTEREHQVLRGLCRNLSNEQIGAEIGISPNTVKVHRQNLRAKLNFHTTHEMVAYAKVNGLDK